MAAREGRWAPGARGAPAHDLTIRGRFMYAPGAMSRLVAMAAAGTLDVGAVDVTSFALGALPAAMEAAARMRGLEAVTVTMT